MDRKLVISISAAVLTGCGGGSTPPDLTRSAVAEAMSTLESAKAPITNAYTANNHAFPPTANPPISTTKPANAKYVTAVFYNATSASASSVVVTLGGTGNSIVDGSFLGAFAIGQTDGTVTWVCGTSSAATSTASSAQTAIYPYLPAPCQH
jgi:type IV pilus assembly protein PilA